MDFQDFIQARKSQLHYYRSIPLFLKARPEKFVLYKKEGQTLGEMRLKSGSHPETLFIKKSDKIAGIQEVQKAFNTQLEGYISTGNMDKVRETLGSIVEETLSEPRSGSLEGVSNSVGIMVREYANENQIIKNLIDVSASDYTTVIHSINVMALVLAYANIAGFSAIQKRILGVSALLHDVGKTKIDPGILKSDKRLTEEEFKLMQRHPTSGYHILNSCKFSDSDIKLSALQHHEKCDGSGYPNKLRSINEAAQIIGIIDCYEALTNDDRPYRNAMEPLKALELLREDVMEGKFNKDLFAKFAQSLVSLYNP
jgi:HD-GYP domain-containing protein (c-di-GMP phosphodiesterase class II)